MVSIDRCDLLVPTRVVARKTFTLNVPFEPLGCHLAAMGESFNRARRRWFLSFAGGTPSASLPFCVCVLQKVTFQKGPLNEPVNNREKFSAYKVCHKSTYNAPKGMQGLEEGKKSDKLKVICQNDQTQQLS